MSNVPPRGRDADPPRRRTPYQGDPGAAMSRGGRQQYGGPPRSRQPYERPSASDYDDRGYSSRLEAGRVERARARQRRRRIAVFAVLAIAGLLIGIDMVRGHPQEAASSGGIDGGASTPPGTGASASASAGPSASASPSARVAPSYAVTGPGTFTYATTPASPVMGSTGTLHRFRVAVENATGSNANEFAAQAEQILGDPRSWIAGNNVRLQRVPQGATYDFTLYLATPGTSETMCGVGGLQTQKYTSCRLPGQVIINLDRWWQAIPDYGAPLDVYRTYAINHEVGHELGHGHEACPGPGKLAPVMQQQTYGLKGCVANPWPYVDGQRYAGASIP